MLFRFIPLAVLAALASGASAQTYTVGNQSFDGAVCVGGGCTSSESFANDADLVVKELDPRLVFEDTSISSGYSTRDWMLTANQFTGPQEYFALTDLGTGREIVHVEADAPANALRVAASGRVGLGTSLPQEKLHIVSSAAPSIVLEQDATTHPARIWKMRVSTNGNFLLQDSTATTSPFAVWNGATSESLVVLPNGSIANDLSPGLHPLFPPESFYVQRSDGSARIGVFEVSATTAPRTLLRLINNGRPEIVMANSGTGGEWSFGAGTNFILKQGALGSDSSVKTNLLQITPAGNATLAGTLTTGGTTCGGGCDLVFSDGYDLPSIADHAAQMFALGHLPNVGPTPEGAPLNVSDKLGRMLNELEHAHIFIARQQEAFALQQAENRAQAALIARQQTTIAAIEARLAALETARP